MPWQRRIIRNENVSMNDPIAPSPSTFDTVDVTSAGTRADRVTAVLIEKIKNGEFAVGARLPTEQVLCDRLGVSRTVVREAISRLKSEGLVEVRQGSGTIVREPNRATAFRLEIDPYESVEAVLRVTELRRGIEAEAAALAAQRCTRRDLTAIKRALLAIDAAVDKGREGADEDLAFHQSIARATGNPLYPPMIDYLNPFVHAAILLTRTNEARRHDFTLQVREEHFAIYEAIAARDPAAARQAVVTHIENAGARIQAADAAFWVDAGKKASQALLAQNPHATDASMKKR